MKKWQAPAKEIKKSQGPGLNLKIDERPIIMGCFNGIFHSQAP